MRIDELTPMRVTTKSGIDTTYYECGSGEAVVFLHGSGVGVSARANWWLNLPVFGERFRAIAPDLVGFGDTTDPPGGAFGLAQWIKHILEFIDALGLDRVSLVGNSLGGWLCLEFAVQHPERVIKIIPMGTGGRFPNDERNGVQTPHSSRLQSYESAREVSSTLFSDYVYDPEGVPAGLAQMRLEQSARPGAAERYKAMSESRARDRVSHPINEALLGAMEVPTLLVHGMNDAVIPVDVALRLARAIPHAELVIFGKCGHWAQIEKADRFNRISCDFLESA